MDEARIRFDDGAAYEAFMGAWSGLVGERFLDWLGPPPGERWVDVGCGNGAFTEQLASRCAPAELQGIDPSADQVAFARGRTTSATFRTGDAMALPYADGAFDAAAMALVIFFVPDPAKGLAEMIRVVRPGGLVTAYVWDFHGGGFPYAAVQDEMHRLGVLPLWPPSVEVSKPAVLDALWKDAGLVDRGSCAIAVERTFESFDAFWAITERGAPIVPRMAMLSEQDRVTLRERMRARLPAGPDGRVTYAASAYAIQGTKPR